MTETQDWRTLPAGAELDVLIAERVLGWSNCHIGLTYRKAMGIPPEYLAKQPPDRTINFPCHHYSQAIGCAWEVVEAMENRGFRLQLDSGGQARDKTQPWTAALVPPELHWMADPRQSANTAPLAICRAAMAALEGARG